MKLHEALTNYLKEGEYEAFMQAWKIQFERYGTLAGTATIPLNQDNRASIENLLGLDTRNKKQIKLPWQMFKKKLSKTKFDTVDFMKVLELYFDEEFITKTDALHRKRNEVMLLLEKLLDEDINPHAKAWIQDVMQERSTVFQRINNNRKDEIKYEDLLIVSKSLDYLPFQQEESIAVFAAKATLDPHAFDQGSTLYYPLTQALRFLDKENNENFNDTELFSRFNLYKEDINNYCSIYGLSASTNGASNLGWEGFYQNKEFWNVNLNNVRNIDAIDTKEAKGLYIIENPSIFEKLVNIAKINAIEVSFMCSNGEPTQILYSLLDKINFGTTSVYYAGDFDPEGLLMAQKLLDRYPLINLWHYTSDNYKDQKSQKKASNTRIKKLSLLTDDTLIQIGEFIECEGIGYQENMLETYIESILGL